MALEQFSNGELNSSVRAKINANFDKLSPRTGGVFTGVFDLSKQSPIKYPDYISGAIVNLSIGASPVPFSTATIKIKGDLLGTVPSTWIPNGDVLSVNPDYTNVITVGYIDATDIRFHNKVLVPADTVAPTYIATYPKAINITETSLSVEVQLNEVGNSYLVVLPDATAAPTSQEVKDGTATGSIAARTVAVPTASTTATMNVTGLASGTAYDIYVVSDDTAGNLQASPVKVDVTTTTSDVIAPTITTATIENAAPTNLVVLFSEVVNITDLTGLTITGTGAPAINSVSGTGTNTLTFTLATAATNGDVWAFDAAAGNNIVDTATSPNGLAAVNQAITNNVAAAGGGYIVEDFGSVAMAYSVRKVSSAYTGPCIRIVTENDGLEHDIGFDGNGLLDESAMGTAWVAAGSTGEMTLKTWYDQSGNARHLTTGAADSRPKVYTANSYWYLNSLPAFKATGNTQIMSTAITGITTASDFSVFADDSSNNWILGTGDTSAKAYAVAVTDGTDAVTNVEVDGTAITTGGGLKSSVISLNPHQFTATNLDLTGWTAYATRYTSSSYWIPRYTQERIIFSNDGTVNKAAIIANQNAYFKSV